MIVWIDAQLPPALCRWFRETCQVEAFAVRDLGLREAPDRAIFDAARKDKHVIITKDIDFVELVTRLGPPPQIVRVTCGNVTTAAMIALLQNSWADISRMLAAGEPLVEFG
jgi:predicted nuclease of predicted toxin-antitoxin system